MLLCAGGLDAFYIDESHDRHVYVVTAISIPVLRNSGDKWSIVWHEYFELAKKWRKTCWNDFGIPQTKELHANKLASGRGNFNKGKYNFDKPKACSVYRKILGHLDFLPSECIMSVAVVRGRKLYGNERLEAAMVALFQRMRKKCDAQKINAITFFDEGHPEYRKLYRKAQIYLPTGSHKGTWSNGGSSKNLPLDMFVGDANEKHSQHCLFTQIADMTAYAAFLKIKNEQSALSDWQIKTNSGNIYDSIPKKILNSYASSSHPRDAIVRIK